ncbi:MAG: hypothetical protein U1C33_08445, partial [Candidatus Cloacimonadaceae bacterium]|nr:hypothetical protein [Candidatus Cloacimonadaceae bacterium]
MTTMLKTWMIIFAWLFMCTSILWAQLSFDFAVISATNNHVDAYLSITNNGTETFSYDFPQVPWHGVIVNGIIEPWAGLTVIDHFVLPPSQTQSFNITQSINVVNGVHSFQAALMMVEDIIPVGEIVYYEISDGENHTIG